MILVVNLLISLPLVNWLEYALEMVGSIDACLTFFEVGFCFINLRMHLQDSSQRKTKMILFLIQKQEAGFVLTPTLEPVPDAATVVEFGWLVFELIAID